MDNLANALDPGSVGIGLRASHVCEVLARRPALGFLEVHTENYLDAGSAVDRLLDLRRDYPLSLHGVGLSLGSAEGIDHAHLARVKQLIDAAEPVLVSEHLAWSVIDGVYLNDLLPLPYTEESLAVVAANVTRMQDAIGRNILLENPSRYLRFRDAPISEAEFLVELVHRTGCGLLLDVNNLHVSAHNVGENPRLYLSRLPRDAVGEIHLAGHARVIRAGRSLLIDDHGAPVAEEVWSLYRLALQRFGAVRTLIEWDRNLPVLETLLAEAARAAHESRRMAEIHALAS